MVARHYMPFCFYSSEDNIVKFAPKGPFKGTFCPDEFLYVCLGLHSRTSTITKHENRTVWSGVMQTRDG